MALWSKFARLSVFSGLTAVTRSPLGVLRAQPRLVALFEAAVDETLGRRPGDGRSARPARS